MLGPRPLEVADEEEQRRRADPDQERRVEHDAERQPRRPLAERGKRGRRGGGRTHCPRLSVAVAAAAGRCVRAHARSCRAPPGRGRARARSCRASSGVRHRRPRADRPARRQAADRRHPVGRAPGRVQHRCSRERSGCSSPSPRGPGREPRRPSYWRIALRSAPRLPPQALRSPQRPNPSDPSVPTTAPAARQLRPPALEEPPDPPVTAGAMPLVVAASSAGACGSRVPSFSEGAPEAGSVTWGGAPAVESAVRSGVTSSFDVAGSARSDRSTEIALPRSIARVRASTPNA